MKPVERVYLQTRLRNLERKYAKMMQHADLLEYTLEIETEITYLQIEAMNDSTIYEAKREDTGLYKNRENDS